ncbi:Hypothetical predicted protein [Olea europaea subsp. europaea]|uniref:Uncharacterized protein n=1 Tax=Olea europaea subsp. europaea TaxID=158383 RepID=A0A8S0RPW5_OLEEU|nr:Hypothetical predicted protein [Olea europaea subsp. europaea]
MVAPVSIYGSSVFDVSPAQGAIATAERPGQRLWGPRSRRRSKARASGERLEGWDRGKNCFSGEKVSNCGPSVFDVSTAQGAIATAEGPGQRLWGLGPRSPRDRKRGASGERLDGRDRGSGRNGGGNGPAIVGSAEPAAIESKGLAGSAWWGGIGKNFLQRREG